MTCNIHNNFPMNNILVEQDNGMCDTIIGTIKDTFLTASTEENGNTNLVLDKEWSNR